MQALADNSQGRTPVMLEAKKKSMEKQLMRKEKMRTMAGALMNTLWRGPATSDLNPFGEAATLLALDINNVGVTATATANTVFLDWVWSSPVLVLFNALFLIFGGLLEVRLTGQLAGGSIGRAMLDRGVSVAEIAEVMNVAWTEKSTGRKGMNRSVTPLRKVVSYTKRSSQ